MGPEEVKELLQEYPFLSGWMEGLPGELLYPCRLLRCSRGQSIFSRGNKIKKVYIVCEGDVIITNNNVNGNEIGVVVVHGGSSVGEMEAMMDLPNLVYSAKAINDCLLLEIPLLLFKKWIEVNHKACLQLAMELAGKLHSSSVSTVHYQSFPAKTRLKLFLADRGIGKVAETRDRLAEICGVNIRTITRAVVSMKEEGLLELDKGKIVLKEEHMKKIAESLSDEISKA